MQQKPSFIPLSPEIDVTKLHDKETGITQCRLSNGIPVNYKVCLTFVAFSYFVDQLKRNNGYLCL